MQALRLTLTIFRVLIITEITDDDSHKFSLTLQQMQHLNDIRSKYLSNSASISMIIKILRLLNNLSVTDKDSRYAITLEASSLRSLLLAPSRWFSGRVLKSPNWLLHDLIDIYQENLKLYENDEVFKNTVLSADTTIRLLSKGSLDISPRNSLEAKQALNILYLDDKNPSRDYVFLIIFDLVEIASRECPESNWNEIILYFVSLTYTQILSGSGKIFNLLPHVRNNILHNLIDEYRNTCTFVIEKSSMNGTYCFEQLVSKRLSEFGCELVKEALRREQKNVSSIEQEFGPKLILLLATLKINFNWFIANSGLFNMMAFSMLSMQEAQYRIDPPKLESCDKIYIENVQTG